MSSGGVQRHNIELSAVCSWVVVPDTRRGSHSETATLANEVGLRWRTSYLAQRRRRCRTLSCEVLHYTLALNASDGEI